MDLTVPKSPSPANALAKRVASATRVPMSVPNLKLAVPEVPGFYLYWHRGKDIPSAIRAGYQFVDDDEVDVEQHNVANAMNTSGSSDMGTRISIPAGGTVEDGNPEPERLYLMKLPNEFREADERARAQVNENVAIALRSGTVGAAGDIDAAKRYMKTGQDLFFPKAKKA
jgi:hypothetical protein